MVGEQDKVVGTRRHSSRALKPLELLVELVQDVDCVRALDPGVMSDFVVSDKGSVYGRKASIDVSNQDIKIHLAQEDGGGSAQ